MKDSYVIEIAKPIVKEFEVLRLDAYKDPVGVWTIGYGHTSRAGPPVVKPGMTISERQADRILENDLRMFLDGLKTTIGQEVYNSLSPNEAAALLSFTFNVGLGNLKKSTLLKKLKKGDKKGAAREFDRWVYAGGKKLRGLVRRRAAERALFEERAVDVKDIENSYQEFEDDEETINKLEEVEQDISNKPSVHRRMSFWAIISMLVGGALTWFTYGIPKEVVELWNLLLSFISS